MIIFTPSNINNHIILTLDKMKTLILLSAIAITLTSCETPEPVQLTVNNNTTVIVTPTTPQDTTTVPVETPEQPTTPTEPTIPQDLNPDWLIGNWVSEDNGAVTLSFGAGYGNIDLTGFNTALPYPHIQYIINSPISTGEMTNFIVHQENNLNWIEFDMVMYSHPDNPMHLEIHKALTNDGSTKINITLTNNEGNYNFRMFIPV